MMNRRQMMYFLGALAAAETSGLALPGNAATLLQAANTQSTFLSVLPRSTSLKIGAQTSKGFLLDPTLNQFMKANMNLVAAGNEFKWLYVRPTPQAYSFTNADAVMKLVQAGGWAFHGHNLCWNAYNPAWFKQVLNKNNAPTYLQEHIRTVAGRYAGKVRSWDVVNEPIAIGHNRPDGLYNGPWTQLIGPEYMDIAFHAAAEADPHALRVLNVHHVELDEPQAPKARAAVLTLLGQLLKRNVPVQAVGLESHLDARYPVASPGRDSFLKSIHDMGLKILITELDVNDTSIGGSVPNRDQAVAKFYADYLKSVHSVVPLDSVIIFSVGDQGNWYDGMTDASYKRSDGTEHRPSLMDTSDQLKPDYYALRDVFAQWKT